jgi:cold shock protein
MTTNIGIMKGIELMQGKVKKFNKEKGFGFIVNSDGKDVFFHYSQLKMSGFKTIDENAAVEFEQYETDRGLQAQNITLI